MQTPPELNPSFDIAILGSGISCSLSLLHLLEKRLVLDQPVKPIKIAVVEKNNEFWRGYPYGSRSSRNSLTITTLGEFVPEKEKKAFISWLEKTQDQWLEELKKRGGSTAETWIQNNLPNMRNHDWEDLYIPRFLFGNFVLEKLNAAIAASSERGLATVETIEAEAISMNKKDNSYHILLEDKNKRHFTIIAHIALLAIGSPPVKSVYSQQLSQSNPHTYINDTYMPCLEGNLDRIRETLDAIPEKGKRNIVMIGSNASSLELLYLVQSRPALKDLINQIVVISYSGLLPHRITPNDVPDYHFARLEQLRTGPQYGSAILMDFIEKDLDEAYEKGVHIGDTYYQLSDLVVELINKMDLDQQKDFFNTYGMKFTKLIRRAGAEYRDAAETMIQDNSLKLIKGKFLELEKSADGNGVSFSYSAPDGKDKKSYPLSFPVVINCGGFEDLKQSSSRIITSLIDNQLCVVNSTQRGFEVNEQFEANKNLYIMGPLLGGIFNSKVRYWHVENAKRIYALGAMLSNILVDYLNN